MSGANFARFGTYNQVLPPEGPKAFPITLDFRTLDLQLVDMTLTKQQGFVSFFQGFYIDNSVNADTLIISMEETGQVIKFPANSQGYLPALITDSLKITFTTTPSIAPECLVPIVLLNIPVMPYIWAVTP